MKKHICTLLVSSLLIIFLPSTVQAQKYVESLTRPIEVATNDGNVYSEIRVVCTGSKGTRYIVRSEDSSKWCATLNGAECKSKKLAAAKKACSTNSDAAITQSIASSSTTVPNAMSSPAVESSTTAKRVVASSNEAVEQERRMIKEEREKISARRKELELRKTELESLVF